MLANKHAYTADCSSLSMADGLSFAGLLILIELGIRQLNFRQNVALGCRLYHRDGVGRRKSIFKSLLKSRLQAAPFGFLLLLISTRP